MPVSIKLPSSKKTGAGVRYGFGGSRLRVVASAGSQVSLGSGDDKQTGTVTSARLIAIILCVSLSARSSARFLSSVIDLKMTASQDVQMTTEQQ